MSALSTTRDDAVDCDRRLTPSTIVVPIDGGETALRALVVARQWAERFSAELVVITVEGEHDRSAFPDCHDDGSEPRTVWRSVRSRGGLVPTVIDVSSQDPSAIVCVGTRAHSPLVDALDDDIAQEVLRSVEVPVLLIGPHCRAAVPDGPVVVAHDGSSGGNAVIDAARIWAASIHTPSVVIHVQERLGETLSDVMPTLRAARAQLGGASLEILPSRFPAGAIREYAQEVDASLLAVSTRGSTGTLAASTGRTATWVVRESACPVLVAHPSAMHAD